jgi:hypothetical protein
LRRRLKALSVAPEARFQHDAPEARKRKER